MLTVGKIGGILENRTKLRCAYDVKIILQLVLPHKQLSEGKEVSGHSSIVRPSIHRIAQVDLKFKGEYDEHEKSKPP